MKQQHSNKGRYVGVTVALFSVALLAKAPIAQADTTGQTTDQTSAVKVISTSDQSASTAKANNDTTTAAATSSSNTAASASSEASSSATSASDLSAASEVTTSEATATSSATTTSESTAKSASASTATSSATVASSAASNTASSASSASETNKQTATVTVNYVNKRTGKTIHAAKTLTGTVGQAYDASKTAVTVDGYTLAQQPTKLTGTYSADTTLTWVYAPKLVTVTVNGYWYDDDDDPYSVELWDSYTQKGYVGDTITVKAADYSDDELVLDDDSATTQTITLGAKDNVVEFYYVDTEDDDDGELTTVLEHFKNMTMGSTSIDGDLYTVGGKFNEEASAILASLPNQPQKVYLIVAANGATGYGQLKNGMNTITIGGETYQLSWGSEIVTVYRRTANGQVMGFEVDASTGEVLNAYVTDKSANGQWSTWQRNYQTNATTTTEISDSQAQYLAQGTALTETTAKAVASKKVTAKAQSQTAAKTLPQTGEQHSGRIALLGSALLAMVSLAWTGLRKH